MKIRSIPWQKFWKRWKAYFILAALDKYLYINDYTNASLSVSLERSLKQLDF